MARRITLLLILLLAAPARAEDTDDTVCTCDVTPAACDAYCACDTECDVDWSVDECAAPDSGCLPNDVDPDEATVEANEAAAPVEAVPLAWPTAAAQVACPSGATNTNGTCTPDPEMPTADVTGGCATGAPPRLLIGFAVLALLVIARRRRALLAIAIASCSVGSVTWDDAVDAGPTGETATYVDVYSADLASGAQYLLANQALSAAALQPAAHFSLARATGGVPIMRTAGACGDRLVTTGGELLGWARADGGDGTAPLTELAAPDQCSFAYETDQAAIDDLVAAGYTITGELGYVWPPGLADMPDSVDDASPETVALAAPATCHVTASSAVTLLYASPGAAETTRFLIGCPGEVIVGDKSEDGPTNEMRTATAHAAGGRTGFVLDRNGDKLRALLNRSNGVERTAAYLRHKLALGYDYIVIDEVTGAPDYADGQDLNRRLRQLMLRMPPRTIIPYISIDLTQESLGATLMRDRRLLLRSFKLHARVLALEVYLQTGQVMAGEAPSVFRTAVGRIVNAVTGMPQIAGISAHEIITIGTSMHSTYPQYRYLDEPSHDLAAIAIEVNAIRHGNHRLRAEHGLGYYFVNKSDMAPPSAYTYDALIRRMRLEALRFK